MMAAKSKRRRWFQFSLRTFLVFIAILCCWLAIEVSRVRRQNEAISTIRSLRGDVFFAHQFDPKKVPQMNSGTIVPEWCQKAIGEEYFQCVVTVNFDNAPRGVATNQASDVTDEKLVLLRALPDVRELLLSNNRSITDAGLQFVSGLQNLRVLTLRGTKVVGPGITHVRGLQNLEGLTLENTPLTDEGLRNLGDLPNLQWLLLDNTQVTDEGMRYLGELVSLNSLSLTNTKITDKGLQPLKKMRGLTRISLSGTGVTEEGKTDFQQSLPACRVFW